MPPRPLLVAALLAVLSLAVAGCLGGPAAPAAADEPTPTSGDVVGAPSEGAPLPGTTPAPTATVALYPFTGHITLGIGADAVGYVNPTNAVDTHIYVFHVEPQAQALVAELHWNDPMQDLDLELMPPSCDPNTGDGACIFVSGGGPGAGDSPVRFVLTDPVLLAEGGEWRVAVWGKYGLNVAFDGAISVFHGAQPDEAYTAL